MGPAPRPPSGGSCHPGTGTQGSWIYSPRVALPSPSNSGLQSPWRPHSALGGSAVLGGPGRVELEARRLPVSPLPCLSWGACPVKSVPHVPAEGSSPAVSGSEGPRQPCGPCPPRTEVTPFPQGTRPPAHSALGVQHRAYRFPALLWPRGSGPLATPRSHLRPQAPTHPPSLISFPWALWRHLCRAVVPPWVPR